MTVSSFIDNLKSYTGENVFNPWRDYDSKSDIGPDAPFIWKIIYSDSFY